MPDIMIDPGHGGRDPGAVGPSGVLEKDVVLAVALHMERALRRLDGLTVGLTRSTDVFVRLEARARMASEADVFVSIHANAAPSPEVEGAETWHHPDARAGRALAGHLQREVLAAWEQLGAPTRDRGLRTSMHLSVLRDPSGARALVELDFLSSRRREGLLAAPSTQRALGEALARAVALFVGVRLPAQEGGATTPRGLWRVVAGSYSTRAAAERAQQELARLGVETWLMPPEG